MHRNVFAANRIGREAGVHSAGEVWKNRE